MKSCLWRSGQKPRKSLCCVFGLVDSAYRYSAFCTGCMWNSKVRVFRASCMTSPPAQPLPSGQTPLNADMDPMHGKETDISKWHILAEVWGSVRNFADDLCLPVQFCPRVPSVVISLSLYITSRAWGDWATVQTVIHLGSVSEHCFSNMANFTKSFLA